MRRKTIDHQLKDSFGVDLTKCSNLAVWKTISNLFTRFASTEKVGAESSVFLAEPVCGLHDLGDDKPIDLIKFVRHA